MSDSEEPQQETEEPNADEVNGEDEERSREALEAELATVKEERDTLEEHVETLEEEIEDLESRVKRQAADFENYKKRQKRKREQLEAAATEELVERLLDVRDNLQRAIDEAAEEGESLREGIKMTLAEFDRVLDAEGVSEIDPETGSSVDPERHEVMVRVNSDTPEGNIVEVYQPGYAMADKVLRPAQVTVSDGTKSDEDADEDR